MGPSTAPCTARHASTGSSWPRAEHEFLLPAELGPTRVCGGGRQALVLPRLQLHTAQF